MYAIFKHFYSCELVCQMVGKLTRQSLENFDQVLNLTLITEQKFFYVVGLTQVLELESTVLSLFLCVLA